MKQEVLQYRHELWIIHVPYLPSAGAILGEYHSEVYNYRLNRVDTEQSPYKKGNGPIFSNYVPGKAWLVSALKTNIGLRTQ